MRRANPEISFSAAYFTFKRDYEAAYSGIIKAFGSVAQAAKVPDALAGNTYAGLALLGARTLVSIVLHEKQVPADKAKAFAKAVKAFERLTRTRNTGALFVKNLASLQLLLETNSWPDKGAVQERTFRVGPFEVHNQTAIDDVTATLKVLEAAHDAIQRSRIPRASEILYGDVYLSGEISRKKTELARYYIQKDTVFLHLLDRYEEHALRGLIHEFGHRYWNRSLDAKTKSNWYMHHRRIGEVDVKVPKSGDTIVVGVHPDKPNKVARVTEIRDVGRGRWFVYVEGGGHFNLDSYLDLARKIARIEKYPSSYASTDQEEHFCEAFSFYCLGDLKEPHQSNFEAIVGIEPQPAAVVASATAPSAPVPKGQLAMFNPTSDRQRSLRRRIRV